MSKALGVLITGAAGAIGMATAEELASRGHSVVATDVSAFSGSERIQAHVLDVTNDDSVARCIKEVGPLDAIVNSAGISGEGPVEDYPLIVSGGCSRQTRSERCASSRRSCPPGESGVRASS